MADALVLTLLGPDRPGLVEDLAALVSSCGGNWLDSRMSHLGGQFAGILRITVAADQQEELQNGFAQLREAGLQISAMPDDAQAPFEALKAVKIQVTGQDHPGIVRDLTHVLAQHEGNIEELNTWTENAPWSGDVLFCASIEVQIPAEVPSTELRTSLESIAQDLMVDLRLEAPQPELA
ncbi:MAG: glycine cleavage system regulatory protein [Puniceicoccaceae bacterium 5H]|nr:MAG: glycine cleavage system regulatory protein [Puniceicoccaceae bacterium 5H]